MSHRENTAAILRELQEVLGKVREEEVTALRQAILTAPRIFVSGAGRSLLMTRCFAMRLMQTGFQVFVVGDTVTPAIGPEDLLVMASGSGETGTLKVVAAGAKKAGAKLALITGNPHSTLGKMADFPVTIPAPTPNLRTNDGKVPTVQPGASAFEQSVLLLTDSLIMDLSAGQDLAQRNREIMRHHANLE